MRCALCGKPMEEDDSFLAVYSGENWRCREGIKFVCKEHTYTTEITFETNSEFVKMLLRSNNRILNWLCKIFVDYEYLENGALVRRFKR